MNNMTRGAVSYLGHGFDDFLFAPIGVERNGMLLSVLSALARQHVDPWQEAKRLNELPEKTAIQRLKSLIIELPNEPPINSDIETIAARLIALLPHRTYSDIRPPEKSPDSEVRDVFSAAISYAIFVACMLFVLNAQWITGSPSAQPGNAHGVNVEQSLPINSNDEPHSANSSRTASPLK